ncbi:hypothetical protein QBC39DRAFT_334893 [Podospora conica]|nr:hypothetical protein QBC39DRAFT_334893 [Schizothecium conicum]
MRILGQIYALKLAGCKGRVRPRDGQRRACRELMSVFNDYSEPFNFECHAFGLPQKAGHEELAVDFFDGAIISPLNEMMVDWNLVHADEKGIITVPTFPGGEGYPALRCCELRNPAVHERVFTHVDPRRPPVQVYYCSDIVMLAARLRACQVVAARLKSIQEWDALSAGVGQHVGSTYMSSASPAYVLAGRTTCCHGAWKLPLAVCN